MRIAFYASYPDQPIGYSKVAYRVANYIAARPEMSAFLYIGTGNVSESRLANRQMHPKIQFLDILAEEAHRGIQDGYGPALIQDILTDFQPTLFFIYNDIIVTSRIFNALLSFRAQNPRVKFVSYLDLVYPFQRPDYVRHVDRNVDKLFVFSECWRQNVIAMGVPADKVHVFQHGFTDDLFFPMPKDLARSFLSLDPTAFVVLNTNRNTYRKCQDITVAGFLEFYRRLTPVERPHVKLFLNCTMNTSSGYDLRDLLEVECLKRGISVEEVLTTNVLRFHNSGGLSDETLNYLMNAADLGVNTACGEGFGLCSLEHGGVGRPQIVAGVGALQDTFYGFQDSIVLPIRYSMRAPNSLDAHSGDLQYVSSDDFADALMTYYTNSLLREEHGTRLGERIRSQFAWDALLETFWSHLCSS